MDQAAPAHKVVPGHFDQCRENPELDRRLRLRARGHYQKTGQLRTQSPQNPPPFHREVQHPALISVRA